MSRGVETVMPGWRGAGVSKGLRVELGVREDRPREGGFPGWADNGPSWAGSWVGFSWVAFFFFFLSLFFFSIFFCFHFDQIIQTPI